ncbi:MAG: aldehyde dehydrogenase, partial [Planctomycetes bacterium]|nr:aldehyde dehydrogenase [Planctomycetota bacterium]
MLHIPILRQGKPYESIDKVEIVHHATGEPVALVSQANSGMIVRDVSRMADDV